MTHKVHINLSLDPVVAFWGLENVKPSLSQGVENWLRIKMQGGKIGKENLIKNKVELIRKIVSEMLEYSKSGKDDASIEKQIDEMARGLQYILRNDFVEDVTIEEAKELLLTGLKRYVPEKKNIKRRMKKNG
jgi:hypothetical protein